VSGFSPLRSRFLQIVFLLLVLGGCWLAWQWHFWWQRPVGHGPVNLPVNRKAFLRTWTQLPVLLVGLGDSVTAGFGASKGWSYFDLLSKNPADEFPDMQGISLSTVLPNLRVSNLAVSGSTSLQHARQQVPKLVPQASNVLGIVVMTTGGNDLLHNYGRTLPAEGALFGATIQEATPWLQNYEQRLERMIGHITNSFPGGCHVFLGTIYDPTDGLGDIGRAGPLPDWPEGLELHSRCNDILRDFAKRHGNVHLVDYHAAFLGHGIHCTQFWQQHYDRGDPHYWFNANLEDPNDRGYDALRRLFLNAISETLAPKSDR
jgi:lysophospholipase L1-like esterase